MTVPICVMTPELISAVKFALGAAHFSLWVVTVPVLIALIKDQRAKSSLIRAKTTKSSARNTLNSNKPARRKNHGIRKAGPLRGRSIERNTEYAKPVL